MYKIALSLYQNHVLPIKQGYDVDILSKEGQNESLKVTLHNLIADNLPFLKVRDIGQLYWYLNEMSFAVADMQNGHLRPEPNDQQVGSHHDPKAIEELAIQV